MPYIIVKIPIEAPSVEALRKQVEEDRDTKDSWFSPQDGNKILIDEMCLERSKADDSFFAFEFVGVEE